MNSANLPLNEPPTDLTNPDVQNHLNEAIAAVNSNIKNIPIVIGGEEFQTEDTRYQVSVCKIVFRDKIIHITKCVSSKHSIL